MMDGLEEKTTLQEVQAVPAIRRLDKAVVNRIAAGEART